jgi:LAO/AO transport system kinase
MALRKNTGQQFQPIFNVDELTAGIVKGDIAALGRGITLIESQHPEHASLAQNLIQNCLPNCIPSFRIGITGVPGVGKSTFIENFGQILLQNGKKVAVLAIDPSSSISKGSILGDKTRMETLVKETHVFIRPSASGDNLGGVARKTRESIILCEAAGFDTILIETVGVGQSETVVHSMVDFFLLLQIPGAGDQLQGIKRGIIEMADLLVINKADGDNIPKANRTKADLDNALHFYPEKSSGWIASTALCSALEKKSIEDIWEIMLNFKRVTQQNGYWKMHRDEQNKYWLLQTIEDRLKNDFYRKPGVKDQMIAMVKTMSENKITPFEAANALLNQ